MIIDSLNYINLALADLQEAQKNYNKALHEEEINCLETAKKFIDDAIAVCKVEKNIKRGN